MRTYPLNSPQAVARIVALTMVADGDIGDAEITWLDRPAAHEQLGLARHELHALLDTFCEDLLSSDQLKWADACPVPYLDSTATNQPLLPTFMHSSCEVTARVAPSRRGRAGHAVPVSSVGSELGHGDRVSESRQPAVA